MRCTFCYGDRLIRHLGIAPGLDDRSGKSTLKAKASRMDPKSALSEKRRWIDVYFPVSVLRYRYINSTPA